MAGSRRVSTTCGAVARPVLRHRVVTTFHAEAEGINADRLIEHLIETVPSGGGSESRDSECLNPQARRGLDPLALAKFGRLELLARLVVEGVMSGLHKSPFKGFSVEFAEHRQYGPGDEIRHIDWRTYGKTDRYYVKEYEEETNLKAYLVVDTSGSMAYAGRTIIEARAGETAGRVAGLSDDRSARRGGALDVRP